MINFVSSTVGKKYLMAAAGLVWVGFVFTHMVGNMLLLVGSDAYNSYSHALTSTELIYIAEAILVLALATHVIVGVQLTIQNRRTKGQDYAVRGGREKGARFASRTMALHGTIILIFIITHLITFKYGTHYDTTVHGVVMRDLYRLVIEIFSQPIYIAWYSVALVLLGFHLSHGVGSVFQSLGLLHPSYQPLIKKASWVYAVVVVVGFLSQPIAAYMISQGGK